jgi:tetratricopeptide (TPR) repeat protein
MSRRLDFLLNLTSKSTDPFAWYGLAMEYRSLSRHDEAISTFQALRARAPDYVPMYLMCGQVLESLGRFEEARSWFGFGIEAASEKGDSHAVSELQNALAALG